MPSFRPLTGIIFWTYEGNCKKCPCRYEWFPSPHGDYFSEQNTVIQAIKELRAIRFPSPHGDYFFELEPFPCAIKVTRKESFRPLTGIIFLNDSHEVWDSSCEYEGVSVPSRGLFFWTCECSEWYERCPIWFPSPHGDYFFELESFKTSTCTIKFRQFPSPHGDYFFELENEAEALNMAIMLRFPSPHGDYFFEPGAKQNIFASWFYRHISVPSRGLFFWTGYVRRAKRWCSLHEFPSPHGDYFFEQSYQQEEGWVCKGEHGFRPLTGIIFLNWCRDRGTFAAHVVSFRPLTGIIFLNWACYLCYLMGVFSWSFRPLTGIIFWTWQPDKKSQLHYITGFRPLTGIIFERTERPLACCQVCLFVSVPSRGLFFLTLNEYVFAGREYIKFPSPHGDYFFWTA